MTTTISDEEFIELWRTHNSPSKLAKILELDVRNIYSRRRSLELKYGIELAAKSKVAKPDLSTAHHHAARYKLGIVDGTVLVFSDAHFWPGDRSVAYRGLLWAINELKPNAVICNGDAFDGASISRFPRIGWDQKPSVVQELEACRSSLGEIAKTAKDARYSVKLVWPLGNHDARFENRLAQNAGEYEGVKGFTLKDHFPEWEPCWSCWPTDQVVIKHRYKNGIHATHNNTKDSGLSMVTGHLHSLKVTPWTDYTGTRFGVDSGTLSNTGAKQFVDYLEDNPTNWRSGFVVLTFVKGQMLWPELIHAHNNGTIDFRGKLIDVSKV